MSFDAEELARLREAFAATSSDDAPRDDCPSADRIWEGVHGQLPPAELRSLIHHLATCPACTEAWRLARSLGSDSAKQAAPRRRPSFARSWHRFAGAAAVAVLVLTLGLVWDHETGRTPEMRAPGHEGVELLSTGPLTRSAGELRWRGPEDTVHYNLRVSRAADPMTALVEERELATPVFRIPPEVLAGLPRGTELLVHVEAVDPAEGRLAAATFAIEVR